MTKILKAILTPGTIVDLHDLYRATNCKTFDDCHNCRGCLSTLQKRGLVISLGNRKWKGL